MENKDFKPFSFYDPLPEVKATTGYIHSEEFTPTEKTYTILECIGNDACRILNIAESQLEQKHKDLLIGEVIKKFEDLPKDLKQQTLNILNEKNS